MNTYNCTEQINHDDETHRETTDTTQLREENQFTQVMDSGINPTTTLRQQNGPRLWCHSVCNSVWGELQLERREMFDKQSRQESIFAEREQIFLVKSINVTLRIFIDDPV